MPPKIASSFSCPIGGSKGCGMPVIFPGWNTGFWTYPLWQWKVQAIFLFPSDSGPRHSLKLISNETRGKFIRPTEFKSSIKASDRRARSVGKDLSPVFREDIGETVSLIYSPFYIHKNHLFDGILNKPIQEIASGDIDIMS